MTVRTHSFSIPPNSLLFFLRSKIFSKVCSNRYNSHDVYFSTLNFFRSHNPVQFSTYAHYFRNLFSYSCNLP